MSKSKEEKLQGIYPCCDTSHKQGKKCPIHEKNEQKKVDDILKRLCFTAFGYGEGRASANSNLGLDDASFKFVTKNVNQAKSFLRQMIEGLKYKQHSKFCEIKEDAECTCAFEVYNEAINDVLNLLK